MAILQCTFIVFEKKTRNKKWNGVHHPAFPLPKIQATGDCFLQHLWWWSARFIHPLAPLYLRRPVVGEKGKAGHQCAASTKLLT